MCVQKGISKTLCIVIHMDDLIFILDILKVDPSKLTEIEKNSLMLYVVPSSKIADGSMTVCEHVKIERLMSTMAYIMGTNVQSGCSNFINDIKTMGWTDDFVAETIQSFGDRNNNDWWGHRLVSEWAIIWLSSLFEEFMYKIYEREQENTIDVDLVY